MGRLQLAKKVLQESMADDLLDWAAALSYYFLFSLFPLMLLLAALLGAFHARWLAQNAIQYLGRALPWNAAQLVADQLWHLVQTQHSTLLSVSTLLLMYTASQGFSGLTWALDVAYEIKETRPYWKRLLLSLGLASSAGIFMAIALAALLLGKKLLLLFTGTHPGLLLRLLWPLLQWGLIGVCLVLAVLLLYRFAPNVGRTQVSLLPAAVTALIIWGLISAGLAFYINHLSNYSVFYGSLGAVIALMLWFYFAALAILVGAEVHSEMLKARGIQLQPKTRAREAAPQPTRAA